MKPISAKLNEAIREVIQETRLEVAIGEMRVEFKTTLTEYFGELEDPRELGKVQHNLIDIITIA